MKWIHWILIISLSIFVTSAPAFAKRGRGGRHHHDRHHRMRHFGGFVHDSHHVIEGIIFGSIVGSAIVNSIPERKRYRSAPRIADKTFLLEPNGDCFLVNQNDSGDQVLTQVPNSNCN